MSDIMKSNLDRLLELNGRHKGETIFLIGAAPSFNDLSFKQLTALSKLTTIALNRVFYRLRNITYFMSAYFTEILIAKKYLGDSSTYIHHRRVYELPLQNDVLTLKRKILPDDCQELPLTLGGPEPYVYTKYNAALAATHLAAILGAKNVVYIGFEQRNSLHYYSKDGKIKKQLINDLREVHANRTYPVDHEIDDLETQLEMLAIPYDKLAATPYYEKSDHRLSFKTYFDLVRKHGVEFYSTTEDSLITDAGAKYTPLEEIL
ncbi:hypothetical protein [Maridesulfovibrio sp.]|uniref:hypothetical protein n=1 Tax=unclassified Maridesulfovibrio TaxID=2794999 RepID=UPI003B0094C3